MLNDTPQWVALYTNSRCERKAAENVAALGVETYLPLHIQRRRWSDRWKKVEVPLFPSYIFARITRRQVVPVRSTPMVVGIVAWRYEPAVVPDSQIEAIRRLMAAQAQVNVVNDSKLKKGSLARIVGGQFNGMEGVLVSDCEGGNFAISIIGLDFSLVMDVEKELLEPLEQKKERAKGIWEKQ